jgi:hypothetical protein
MASSPQAPGLNTAQSAASTTDRQMAKLLGESVFGPWLDPAGAKGRARRRISRPSRLRIVVVSAIVAAVGVWLVVRGFSHQAAQERTEVAKDVAAFLAEGELERLSQYVAILSPPAEPLQPTDPYVDLVVRAEAVLYRYHDANPARLARIQPLLSPDQASPSRVLARLTVASNAERLAAYATLKALELRLAKEPEFWTLLASAEEGRNVAAAKASWDRSFDVGPLWLPHRYLQHRFEARRGSAEGQARIARHMAKVAPDSPWTRLALASGRAGQVVAEGAGTPVPPVAQYHERLAATLATASSPAQRRQSLEGALAAVKDGVPFVLDAFDWLMAAKAQALAIEMTSFEGWPRSHPMARAKLVALATGDDTVASEQPAQRAEPGPTPGLSSKKAAAKSKKTAAAKKVAKHKKRGGRRR